MPILISETPIFMNCRYVEQRTPERMREVGGNVDYERFEKTVLEPLQKKQNVFYQPFSCREWKLMQTSEIPYRQLNIIEGSYSLHPYFKDPYDLHIFMDIDPDSQMENIVKRNGIEKAKDFQEKWIPKEEAYFDKFRVQDGAVRILSSGGWVPLPMCCAPLPLPWFLQTERSPPGRLLRFWSATE